MKRAIALLTGFGLLVVSVLVADTIPPLKADACLDASYNEAVTNREFKMLATGNSSIDARFDAFRESATAVIETSSAMPAQATWTSTVTWLTWTATVARVATGVATYTVRTRPEPSSPLLDRLVRNKPSIWGNKSFYILLGVLYLTLLCLFLRQIISPLGPSRDVHDEFTHNSRQSY